MNFLNQFFAAANQLKMNFQMTQGIAQPKEKDDQLNLLQSTILSNLIMAQQMQSAASLNQQTPVISKTKKISKKNNNCGHPDKEHYAKGMCSNCYHKYGRTKKPWICGHEKLYAQGLCQNCYINKYNQKRREQGEGEKQEEQTQNQEKEQ